tara:strand:+ start:1674 stop:1892 length:219 start_codon:yes stop_codon:yes gene_type:complete
MLMSMVKLLIHPPKLIRSIKMPTKEEMSEAYIVSIEAKIVEMENQIETLKNHVTECRTALEEGEENEDSTDD